MAAKVQPIPLNYNTVTPLLIINQADSAIKYYEKAFQAKELYRLEYENRITHAEILIGNSRLMLMDEFPEMGAISAKTIGSTPISLMIYVQNVDETFKKAIDLGAKVEHPLMDQFYGDRIAAIVDPFGFKWTIAQHIKNIPQDEINRLHIEWRKKMKVKGGATNEDYYRQKYLQYKQKYNELKRSIKLN